MKGRWLIVAPLALLGMTAFIALGGGVVMVLWNWLLPSLFGWPALTFWKALGLLALCRILSAGSACAAAPAGTAARRIGRACGSGCASGSVFSGAS